MPEFDKLPKSGFSPDAASKLLLNAGAFLTNLRWDSETNKWSGDLMGATSGGSSLSMVNTYRQAEIDGAFAPTVGSDSIESSEGTFEINFIEFTLDNLKRSILADVEISNGEKYPTGYQVLTPRRNIAMSDYVENMAYVGTLSGNDNPVIIIMHNSICTSGLEVSPQDKNDNVYTLTFSARASADDVENTSLPITILYPTATTENGGNQEGQGASGQSFVQTNSKGEGIDGAPKVETTDTTEETGGKK